MSEIELGQTGADERPSSANAPMHPKTAQFRHWCVNLSLSHCHGSGRVFLRASVALRIWKGIAAALDRHGARSSILSLTDLDPGERPEARVTVAILEGEPLADGNAPDLLFIIEPKRVALSSAPETEVSPLGRHAAAVASVSNRAPFSARSSLINLSRVSF